MESATALEATFADLTAAALDRPATPPFDGLSFINADGLPFQWCLRLRPQAATFGFICEGGPLAQAAQQRAALSVARLRAALAAGGSAWPRELDDLIRLLLPSPLESWPVHWRSAIWAGVAASGRALVVKPYFNLDRDDPRSRWERLGHVLARLDRGRSLEILCNLSGRVSRGWWPVGLTVDVLPPGRIGRVKAYFRSQPGTGLDGLRRWYEAVGAPSVLDEVQWLLDSFPCARASAYPARSFFVSIEFHERDGEVSLKTDLAPGKWVRPADVLPGVRRSLAGLGIGDRPLLDALRAVGARTADEDGGAWVRLVGHGYEPDGSRHVNVYVEPPHGTVSRRGRRPSRPTSATAEYRALRFLASSLRSETWSDFALPTGASDAWVTAYVLTLVRRSRWLPLGDLPLEPIRDRLAEAQRSDGGWSYSSEVASDADSTSWALRALRGHERVDRLKAAAFLRRCQNEAGGVATYPLGYELGIAWAAPSADVTAAALLVPAQRAGLRRRAARAWLDRHERVNGLWPSYWWTSPLYATSLVLELAMCSPTPALMKAVRDYRPVGAFETALLLVCAVHLGDRAHGDALAHSLLEAQLADGSWTASAYLRLTRPAVERPWSAFDPGVTYVDTSRIFTTATVIGALSALREAATPAGGTAGAASPPPPA